MKSYSRNHLRPAFNHLTTETKLAASLGSDNPPSAEELHLWSYQLPTLRAGTYTVSVSQEITLPNGETVSLDSTTKDLHVPLPKFRLADPDDLYSVHPAPGHSAHARTLANVVFSQPTTPWERKSPLDEGVGSNKLPYMAVLTFSDEELILDPEAYKGFGFTEEYELSTEYGSVVTIASRLSGRDFPIKSALNALGASDDYDPNDHVSLLVLDSEIFKKVFRAYDKDNKPVWNGNADLTKFAFMASTQDSGSGFTASSFADDSGDTHRPHFSVVVSPRTGPPGISSPTRVVSHLISLEDVEKIAVSPDEVTGQYVGLVSLHSWEWVALPDTAGDFGQIMTNLGVAIAPLEGPYSDQVKGGPPEALAWSKARAEEGYVLKPHTDITGAQTKVLMRGPLIPVEPSKDPPEAFSLYGEGLARFDKTTGIPDVSYKSAWTLGRSMMMADRAVSASLLRLRGNIHSEAVRRAKAKALYQKGYGILGNRDTYLAGLEDAVKHLQKAQDISNLHKRSAADRWARPDNSNLPVMRLSNDTSYSIADYEDQVNQVTLHMFGYESKDAEGNPVPVRQIDVDAATIRAWAVDRFLLAGVPMHSLILDPTMLPEESIRTFCVDDNWIDWLVDGGLSLANHFTREDDAIRKSFKECINTYLNTPMDEGTIPQLPRWGFLMRSTAVSAFPDLKVEAPLPENAPDNARQVQFMQVLAEDVLVCLFDRRPGEQEFSYIRISQPHHQQGFCLGKTLSATKLQVYHRPVPKEIGQKVGSAVGDPFEDEESVLAFDFKARMLRPSMYMIKYNEAIKDIEGAFTAASDSSSLLATQLRTYNLRLQLNAKGDESHGVSSSNRWTKAAVKLSTGSRPGPGNETSGKESTPPERIVRAPPSSNVTLPTGPRVQVRPPIYPYDFEAKSNIQKKPQTLHELESSNTLPYSATPLHVNCCLCYEPGKTGNMIYAPETPTDLIFNISAEESSGLPAEVELRIPVALSSGIYPPGVKDGSRGVLVIPGTGNQPITPTLEDLSPSEWWSFDHKLATSSLYSFLSEALPDEGDSIPIETGKLIMLIIKIKPRFEGLVTPQTMSFKTSFLLRGVTFLLPKPKPDPSADWPTGPSRDARFDLLWRPSSPGGQTTVRTTQLTIRPATIVILGDNEINFDLNKQNLSLVFILSRLPPSGAQARLLVTRQGVGKPFKETFELPKDPKPDPDGRGYLYSYDKIISKLGYFVPRETRLTIVTPDNGRMLGPDSAPFVFPQVPDRDDLQGSCSLYWGSDRHVSIIWPPLNAAHVPVKHKIALINRLQGSSKPELSRGPIDKEKEIVRFKAEEVQDYQNEGSGLTIKVTITVDTIPIHGTVVEWVANLTTVPTVQEGVEEHGMPVTTSLQNPGPALPVPTSRFPSMRFWSESGTAGFKTDMWYWRDGRRLAGIRWNASEATANEEAGPNIPQSKPDLTGAGALAVIQMHQDQRFKIVWIGNDGSVNLWSRENEGMGPENWTYSVLAPPGSASTLGGGCLAACGEVPVKQARPRRNPVIWWLGPRGEIFGRRAVPEGPNSEQWVDVEPGASLPAGSVDVTSSLARPAQMTTTWMYDSRKEDEAAYLFWVRSNGDLMGTCSYTPSRETNPPLTGTAIAYRNVGAAPGTSVTAFIGNGTGSNGPMNAKAYVLWVSTDGSLCLGSTGDVNWVFYGSSWDPIIRIASPGCANPLSDICLLGHSSNTAVAVAWVDPGRRLQLAWAKSIPGAFGRNEWSPWGWKELAKWIPRGQALVIARAEAPDALGRNMICFPTEGGGWKTCSVDLSSIKP
ncbi:hypothetical protein LCI18_001989 [Fusarium solani-melongenae]|uniref:Uncharacterized protein n=1 Tax=Fusarium solani subsp. cucurbitae TaxID=2747967 RepID=A0ACD3YPZ3_FUSSC|nr:hypothetical protein LCI18_001989 [Fusarium solani-melongenae]